MLIRLRHGREDGSLIAVVDGSLTQIIEFNAIMEIFVCSGTGETMMKPKLGAKNFL